MEDIIIWFVLIGGLIAAGWLVKVVWKGVGLHLHVSRTLADRRQVQVAARKAVIERLILSVEPDELPTLLRQIEKG